MRKGMMIENGELAKDLRTDSSGKIISGVAIGETDAQNMQVNIEMNPGDLKEHPALGCGIYHYTKGNLDKAFYRRAAISLEMDGYNLNQVQFSYE